MVTVIKVKAFMRCVHANILALPLGLHPLGMLSERWQAHQHGKLEMWMPCRRRGLGARSTDQVRPEAPPRPLKQREGVRPLLVKCSRPSLLRERATKPVRRHGGGKVADRPKEALANCNWHD